jgi:hypothetical protein
MREGDPYPDCFDPYLRYAISTDFEYFEFFDGRKSFRLFFLAEFKQADFAPEFEREMRKAGFSVEFGPALDNIRYATLRTRTSAVLNPRAYPIWDRYVSRVELSLPLKPSTPEFIEKQTLAPRWKLGFGKGNRLLGVLDDGCPFAAAQFLRANASASTRVCAIWDQNQGKQPVKVKDSNGNPCLFGQTLSDFNYGLEYQRDSEAPRKLLGLDEWMRLHWTPTGSIDEDGCYADAGFTRLKPRESHGAHVMDVLAGRIPASSRIGPSPSWSPGNPCTDPACDADVVFVQFPENCIRDATGVWLKAYVLDGIRYILSFADPNNTDQVIINVSYGSTTGPHDGTAVLEEAMTALVKEFDGSSKKPKLEIVLAAGNSYLSEEHVFFIRHNEQPNQVEWTWRLPPDNTVLCFAEIWMDCADADGVTVTLTSPSGSPLPVDKPIRWGKDTVWRLEVGPTVAAPGIDAEEHGDYSIKLECIHEKARIHAYVARTDPNMGVITGAKRSYFVDKKWEQTRSAEAGCTYTDGEFDKTGSLVCRYGTLNGIATGKNPNVHVAGGDMLANERKSPYSSAGPARGDPYTHRVGPDYALFCDESYALEGVRAGGNRSGSVFRLIGTSAAAPQLARWVARPKLPQPTNRPTTCLEREKRGCGNIEPP